MIQNTANSPKLVDVKPYPNLRKIYQNETWLITHLKIETSEVLILFRVKKMRIFVVNVYIKMVLIFFLKKIIHSLKVSLPNIYTIKVRIPCLILSILIFKAESKLFLVEYFSKNAFSRSSSALARFLVAATKQAFWLMVCFVILLYFEQRLTHWEIL